MSEGGGKEETTDTVNCEVDDEIEDLVAQVDMEDILDIQMKIMDELSTMIQKEFDRHKLLYEAGTFLKEGWSKKVKEMEDEVEMARKLLLRTLKWNYQQMDWKVHKFRGNIREVLSLYVDVNNQMKIEEKQAAKQDDFIQLVEETQKELDDLKQNIRVTQELFGPVNPGVVVSRTNLSTEKLANHIEEPYRPCETEMVRELPLAKHLPGLVAPIKELGEKVSEMMLKEFPAKTTQDFLNTLPPKQRD
ncbi:Protein CBG07119 [Caenorhabditis briggsae]|uniref:Protein CBG07119 n=1 Tax=Caenorhabditis briggsae TaxID=6238 RepID=A8X3N4_CAEBR|nr:Protein CBG07119 [Caenorhabditis briggsae]CAP27244.2 Protein CBG07119 [Caenorhabditis briggsae]